MKLTRLLLLPLAAAWLAGSAAAQAGSPGVPDTSIFAPLNLSPAAGLVRAGSGAPGSRYWQNRADYTINAAL
ncbi:MAG TPA: hypothetical protein VFH27_07190, partial [Longimicrobiaceae bacterium]|nr:hypothetical protein [Longimicrobiaceae bacterium]